MLYGFLFLLASDRVSDTQDLRNLNRKHNIRKWSYLATLSVSVVLITAGFINAHSSVKDMMLLMGKTDGINSMRVVAVSDIHLGSVIRKRSVKNFP